MANTLDEILLNLGFLLFDEIDSVLIYITSCHAINKDAQQVRLERRKQARQRFLFLHVD